MPWGIKNKTERAETTYFNAIGSVGSDGDAITYSEYSVFRSLVRKDVRSPEEQQEFENMLGLLPRREQEKINGWLA